MLNTNLEVVVARWDICLRRIRPDCLIQGSPERTQFRTVFEDDNGRCFLLEQIGPRQYRQKHMIIETLNHFHRLGLKQINPYIPTPSGDCLPEVNESFWQLSRFVDGTPLQRPDYLGDGEKGESLAAFLLHLEGHARHTGGGLDHRRFEKFSLKNYVLKMRQDMARHDPDILAQVRPVFSFLDKEFMDAHDTLPLSFCHGDYHPLNVIWSGHELAAVIDWEFLGIKPEIYDAANLVGCLGMEHPRGLNADLVRCFMRTMKARPPIARESWDLFPEFVIALRFAWLAEWLRKKDAAMIDLEIIYLNILLDNLETLNDFW
jgi:homoserine kinase type II